MEPINFTQFCDKNNYPSNYDILNHSVISPNGRISKRAKACEMASMQDRINLNIQAHAEYEALILSGDIVDPSGDYTRAAIVRHLNSKIQSQINALQSRIDQTHGLGKMAHTKSGKLRIGYQRAVNDYNQQIEQLRERLIN